MSPIDRLREFWTVTPPVRLIPQPSFNGVTITPKHTEKKVLMPRKLMRTTRPKSRENSSNITTTTIISGNSMKFLNP